MERAESVTRSDNLHGDDDVASGASPINTILPSAKDKIDNANAGRSRSLSQHRAKQRAATTTAIQQFHRRQRFNASPWKEGEREALLANYTGPVTRCPSAIANGVPADYVKPFQHTNRHDK